MELCDEKECLLYGKPRVQFYGDNKDVVVAFVGESPGKEEELAGVPFIGRSGVLLREQAIKAGLSEYNTKILNSAMCLIPKEELKIKEVNSILSNCRCHLEESLKEVKPKVIVALGALAAQQLLKIKTLGDVRGTFVWSEEFNCYILPTYHPAFILRKPSSLDLLSADLRRVKVFLLNGCKVAKSEEIFMEERESIEDVLSSAKVIALDTETQGLDYINPSNIMISYSVSGDIKRAYQIFIHEECEESLADFFVLWERGKGKKDKKWVKIPAKRSSNFASKLDELRCLLKSNTIKKVMMNGNYDLHHILALFRNNNLPKPEINNYTLDVQNFCQTLNENIYARSSLELLRKSFTTLSTQYSDQFGETFDKGDMLSVPRDNLAKYAAADAAVTLNVAYGAAVAMNKEPEKAKLLYYYQHMVMPVTSKLFLSLEETGVSTDASALPVVREELQRERDYLYKKIINTIPPVIKDKYKDNRTPEAPLTKLNMIKEMLYGKEGFGVKRLTDDRTRKEIDSVDKKVRRELSSRRIGKKAIAFIEDFDRWRMIDTLISKYITSIEKATRIDGKIHPSFSLAVTATGRSCLAEYTHVRVKTDNSNYLLKTIQDIRAGDIVYSYKESTGEMINAPVQWAGKTGEQRETILVRYTLAGAFSPSGQLRCTPEHLIYTLGRGFVEARYLHPSDKLLGVFPERVDVESVTLDYKKVDVYDLTIEGPPNFIANGVCVHNSASAPNLQNIPKRGPLAQTVRRLFIPTQGRVFLAVDASQSELRWLAFLSQDPVMLGIYRAGGDIHATTAEAIRGKSRNEMTPEEFKSARQASKAVNFGFIFGAGARTFQRVAKLDYGVILTEEQAQDFRRIFFETYPAIKAYHRNVIAECHQRGYVMSPLGRVRRLLEVNSRDNVTAHRAERQELNHAIQSVSSDAVLLSGVELLNELNLDECFPCLFIHDELIFECEEDKVSEYAPIIKYHMEHPPLEQFGVTLNLPLVADMKVGKSLADLEEYTIN